MPEMSWLSPKRRRTTGNLKTVPNGQVKIGASIAEGNEQGEREAHPNRTKSMDRPPATPRPLSQPNVSNGTQSGDGNLFYAYARQGNDLHSRYLLTFASAAFANEWWLLVQAHFPDCTRPGPQLFSFKTTDLLAKAWKHAAFEHLKSKWMYIAFSDTSSHGLGGAAQGIIPVQDAQGNMLGGGAPAGPDFGRQVKQEAKSLRNEKSQLEEHFGEMMEAVERNTEGVKKLAEGRDSAGQGGAQRGYFDTSELAGHFGRITDLLARNQEYMETMSKRQFENEKKLRAILEETAARRETDRLDLSHLTSHLDRIQQMMEKSVDANPDMVKRSSEDQLDLSPLVSRLDGIQQAMERNSMLLEDFLDNRDEMPTSSYPQKIDLSGLADHLGVVYAAVEKQSENLQTLVDLATKESERAHESTDTLQQILEAQRATRNAVEQNGGEIDFTPMAEHLDAMAEATAENTEHLRSLVDATLRPNEHTLPAQLPGIDFSPMTDRLDRVHASLERTNDYFQTQVATPGSGSEKFLLSALSSHLSKVQAVVESNANAVKVLREPRPASQDGSAAVLREMNENLKALSRSLAPRPNTSEPRSKADADALEKRLEATNSQVRELMTGQREMVSVLRELSTAISAQSKGACDHVVIPPPRKVGKKLVGFVYDAKEGAR
ncbi:hypothetical protein AC578_3789 [Pseudocercospora eumusae]|uniref:Uncharacterized protein n=1 Tax=Pseudocercospora eumusae TaxID=321146 RepID=A0A139HFN1_9PEZI|nr:hypothetical protein AC578_3789 [Pseudocercospora eumusae]